MKFGKRRMKDLASKDKFFIVTDSKDIENVFDDIADKITTTSMPQDAITIRVGQQYQLEALVNGKVTGVKAGKVITAEANGRNLTIRSTGVAGKTQKFSTVWIK